MILNTTPLATTRIAFVNISHDSASNGHKSPHRRYNFFFRIAQEPRIPSYTSRINLACSTSPKVSG